MMSSGYLGKRNVYICTLVRLSFKMKCFTFQPVFFSKKCRTRACLVLSKIYAGKLKSHTKKRQKRCMNVCVCIKSKISVNLDPST